AGRAERTASPVPRGSAWTATSTPSNAPLVSGAATTTSGSAPTSRAAASTQSTIRRPSSVCRCLGVAERIRVPRPAAMTTAPIGGWLNSGEDRWLGRQDSNLGSRDQNPLPYHLATPHCGASIGASLPGARRSAGRRGGLASPTGHGTGEVV